MALFGGPKVSVGLDIGTRWIKVVSAVMGGGGRPQITKAVCVKNSGDAREAIRKILSENNIKPGVVVACLDSQDAEMIVQEFIVKTAKEAERLAEVKMREFNLNEFAINYSLLRGPVPGADGSPVFPVLYVSAEKSKVSDFQSLLRTAGINLDSLIMDVDQLAAINALELDQAAVGTTCLIEGGATTTNISILKDGTLRHTAIIRDDGGAFFTNRLAQELGISVEQAEELKIANGIDAGSNSRFGGSSSNFGSSLELDDSISGGASSASSAGGGDIKYLSAFKDQIEPYLDKIINILKDYQDKNSDHIKEIVLTGGLACTKNIAGFTKNYLNAYNFKVDTVNLAESPFLSSLNCPDEQRQTFTVALGLSLRGFAE
jgi:Tfp pilus assembly PilM family ATPase